MVNYFDLGAHKGRTVELMLNAFHRARVSDYRVFAFEPCAKSFDKLNKKFASDKKVLALNMGVGNGHRTTELYHAINNVGHSIFDTKTNIIKSNTETVNICLFSGFINTYVRSFKMDINILKSNIEGAETYLFSDLIRNKMLGYFDMFLGHPDERGYPEDINKIGKSDKEKEAFVKLLSAFDVRIKRFTDHREELNFDIVPFLRRIICRM